MKPYKHISSFIIILFLILPGYKSIAQENCANGVDDDGDGLADLYDPDCQCHFTVTGNLLQNGSFESYDHCPSNYSYDKDHNIAIAWDYGTYTNVNEATFYHNLNCAYDAQQVMLNMPPNLPLPDGNAFISILNSAYLHPIPERNMTKSYVGQCLQSPLLKGESYTLSFYAGRFRSWDNLTGKIFPFDVAVFGSADCSAVPFGKVHASGNGCPSNYSGWVLLGETTMHSSGQWVQGTIKLNIPYNINLIEIGVDCNILAPIVDLTDSTTYLDYHIYYLDDLHLLPTKDFPFEYIQTQLNSACNGLPVLEAPVVAGSNYQWYKDSVAIAGANGTVYAVPDTSGRHYYNVLITSPNKCIASEPFLVLSSKLNAIHIPPDTILCMNDTMILSPALDGISYNVNGETSPTVIIMNEGSYNITATDINGCQKSFVTNITKENCAECDAFMPGAFTPNGDGLNDVFKPTLRCPYSDYHFSIFNRWGQKIFESRDSGKGWDGSFKGMKLPPGAYVYFVDYKTSAGVIKTAKGTVIIIL